MRTLKEFLLESPESVDSGIEVTVTGDFDKSVLDKIVASIDKVDNHPSILKSEGSKVTVLFDNKVKAKKFTKACHSANIRTYISSIPKWTAYAVVKNILDGWAWDENHEGSENYEDGFYQISKPWVPTHTKGITDVEDYEPGQGGAIGLPKVHGTSPADLATAAHEAYHAYAHQHGLKDKIEDENWVNDMAEKWLRSHLQGSELQKAINYLNVSRHSYNS